MEETNNPDHGNLSQTDINIQKELIGSHFLDLIHLLPTFDGDQYALRNFIGSVEDMVLNVIKNVYKTDCPAFIMRAIRGKVVGEADKVLIWERTSLNWQEMKEMLLDKFADHRSMDNLMENLMEIRNLKLTIFQLYVEILKIRFACFGILERQYKKVEFKKHQELVYEKQFVNTFIAGLRGPLKYQVVRKQPKTLGEAYDIAMQLNDSI